VAELEELRHRMAEIEAKLEIEDRAVHLSNGSRQPAIDSPGSLVSAAEASVPTTGVAGAESRGARR